MWPWILALAMVGIPMVELIFLLRLGSTVGTAWAVFLVASTGLLGAMLARHEGLRTIRRALEIAGRGEVPGRALLDGLAIVGGGLLLLTPGLLTDGAGFLLLLPPSRAWFCDRAIVIWRKRLRIEVVRNFSGGGAVASESGRVGFSGDRGVWDASDLADASPKARSSIDEESSQVTRPRDLLH